MALVQRSQLQQADSFLFLVEKPSGLYLGLYVMSNWLVLIWIWIQHILFELTYME
jgi:hypothetical protein